MLFPHAPGQLRLDQGAHKRPADLAGSLRRRKVRLPVVRHDAEFAEFICQVLPEHFAALIERFQDAALKRGHQKSPSPMLARPERATSCCWPRS